MPYRRRPRRMSRRYQRRRGPFARTTTLRHTSMMPPNQALKFTSVSKFYAPPGASMNNTVAFPIYLQAPHKPFVKGQWAAENPAMDTYTYYTCTGNVYANVLQPNAWDTLANFYSKFCVLGVKVTITLNCDYGTALSGLLATVVVPNKANDAGNPQNPNDMWESPSCVMKRNGANNTGLVMKRYISMAKLFGRKPQYYDNYIQNWSALGTVPNGQNENGNLLVMWTGCNTQPAVNTCAPHWTIKMVWYVMGMAAKSYTA